MSTGSALGDRIRRLIEDSIAVKRLVLDGQVDQVVAVARVLFDSLASGGKVMLCGNGGSAADAQHLAAELLVRLRPHINRSGVPALALAVDTSSLTACGNDYGFDVFYERLVQTLGKPGDVLIGISTSGKSPNVVRALRAARAMKIRTVGLLGGDGGEARSECDLCVVVPSSVAGRIQEAHITIGHALMECVEDLLLDSGLLHRLEDN